MMWQWLQMMKIKVPQKQDISMEAAGYMMLGHLS
jgi:hypothetical protein